MEQSTNCTWYHIPLLNRSLLLSPASVPARVPNHSGLHFPAISRLRYRPISWLCGRPFSRISMYTTDSRLCSLPISRLCSRQISRTYMVGFTFQQYIGDVRPVASTEWLPASPSHSRPALSKRDPFPIPSLGKSQNEFRLRWSK